METSLHVQCCKRSVVNIETLTLPYKNNHFQVAYHDETWIDGDTDELCGRACLEIVCLCCKKSTQLQLVDTGIYGL